MPSIASLSKQLTGYHPVDAPAQPPVSGLTPDSPMSTYLRCPIPQIGIASSDSLDQFNRKGAIPQFRVFVKQ